jgi:signal transduction histidine kinase
MERGLRGYLLTGENFFIQSYDSAILENETLIKDLSELIPDTSVQYEDFKEIQVLYNRWVNNFAGPLRTAKAKADSSGSYLAFNNLYRTQQTLGEEEKINKELQQKFRELIGYEYNNRERRKDILSDSERKTKNISFSLTALSIIIGFVIAIFLASHISARILSMVKMSNSIAAGNYQVQVKDKGNDELSKLSNSLNHMSVVLSENISLLKRKNEELDQFAHIVSHDLKAPLRGIDNVISWIEEDHGSEVPPKVTEYLQLIKGRLNRSESLIQGILSYARIGKEVETNEEIDLRVMVAELLENLPSKQGLKISVSNHLPVVITERFPLMQVFSNLISNAIKYHNKPTGEIKIYSEEKADHYVFFVEDDGPGIEKTYHDKIFVIFQTLQERDSFESTGVGLAIVKKILDARKEQIMIKSEPGKGSVFSFTWSKF